MKRLLLILTLLMPTMVMGEVIYLECRYTSGKDPLYVAIDVDKARVGISSLVLPSWATMPKSELMFDWQAVHHIDEDHIIWIEDYELDSDFQTGHIMKALNRKDLRLWQTGILHSPMADSIWGPEVRTCTRPI